MAFADHIGSDVGVFYYLRISGIPYVFHNAPALPAAWLSGGVVTIDSEDYTPSGTLIADKGFTYKNGLQPKAGIGKSSGMEVTFALDDTWLDLTSIHVYRDGGARYSIYAEDDVTPGDTTIDLDSSSGASPTDVLYAGLETMEVATVPTGTSITATRGRYDSQQRRFAGATDGLIETGSFGAWMLDHPGAWVGRTVQLWMGTGIWDGSTFVPFGSSIESAEDKRIFLGTIARWKITPSTHRVSCTLQPLDRVLGESVAFRLPTFEMGHRSITALPVDDESDRVEFDVFISVAGSNPDLETISTPLLSSLGKANAFGVIPLDTLFADIAYTINNHFETVSAPAFWTSGTTKVSFSYTTDDSKLSITANIEKYNAVNGTTAAITIRAIRGSVWRVLGFTGTHSASSAVVAGGTTSFAFAPQRALPWLYISPTGTNDTTGLRLWYRNIKGAAFQADPGFDDVDGNNVPAYVRVGTEVFEVTAATSWNEYGTPWTYLTTSGRAKLGSIPQEHYVEAGEEIDDAVQLVALPGVQLPKAWLYLLLGGSGTKTHNHATYDQAWYGSGSYVDSQWVNVDSFENIATARGLVADNLAVGESTPLRDVVQGDLIAQGLSISAGPDGIELLDVSAPAAIDVADAVMALDSTNTRTIGKGGRGIPLDLGEDKIVNDCLAHVSYDNGAGAYTHKMPSMSSDSIGTYGRKQRLEFKMRAFRDRNVAREAIDRILSAYKQPYAIIDVDVHHPLWWTVKLGDVVTITNTVVPTISSGLSQVTPGRGIVALPARVMDIEHAYPKSVAKSGGRRGHARLLVGNISGGQRTVWSPSAYCSARTGATCTITARYGGSEGAEFATDDLVILRTYDSSTIENAEVSTAATGTIVLKATPTIAAPFLIEPREYVEALQAAQRLTAYGTDGDHVLNGPSTNDIPKEYA